LMLHSASFPAFANRVHWTRVSTKPYQIL